MDKSRRNKLKAISGAALAVAAAGLFLSGSAAAIAADTKEANVQCGGVNACKGKSECSTAKNGCKGQNECKGQGFKAMTASACLTAGGTIGDLK